MGVEFSQQYPSLAIQLAIRSVTYIGSLPTIAATGCVHNLPSSAIIGG
jgi:hypothetical protein